MKKLLVTAIGAAVAFGAFADAVRFEESTAGTVTALSQLPGGTSLWSEPEGATNTYAIGAAGTVSAPLSIASSETQPTQALDIKTTFGKPLSLNAVSGGTTTNINDGLYFDSLVKFTVCEDAPADTYSGAKIIMWLQEVQDANGNATGTNLIVRAGYLSLDGATVTATPSNYVCSVGDNFNADAWHRVTIKAIADITKTNRGVPGFAIYLDENGDTATSDINVGNADTLDASFPASELTEAATLLNNGKALFPSLDQTSGTKATLTSASFDGTGSITDLIFTDNGPAFAKDMVAQKASVTINEIEQTGIVTLADAIDAANGAAANAAVVITLAKGFDFDAPVTIKPTNTGVSVVLDFNGFVIENTGSECLITNAAVLTVTDSSVGATGGIVGKAIYQGDGSLTINGGKFWTLNAFDLSEATTVSIAGGSFKDDDTAFETGETESGTWIADGMTLQYNSETGLNDVVEKTTTYAAQIGESKYETLAEALAEAKAGDTIELLTDATATAAVSTAAGTLDLGGYTLTLPQDANKVASLTFTGAGAKTLKGGDLMGVYHELTITTLGNEGLTLDGMTFHASVKPAGTNGLFKATNCQFLCDFDKTGAAFTDGSSADVHSYGVMFFGDSQFAQADIVNSYFDQGRRAAVQASFAGDLYFYGNTVVADKLTSRVDGAGTRYPALQIISNGRVFIENNTFSGQYLGEAFCVYNKGTYRTTDKAIVFSGNTVSNGVNYLWGIYDVDASGSAPLVNPDLYFGANTVGDQVNLTGCIYKTTVDGVDMNGVTYSHTPATLALPNGVASVYAWTHAADAKPYYVDGVAADAVSAGTVIAVPGAAVASDTCILTADATLKNQYTAVAAAAKVGNTLYATFKEAVDAANAGDTVVVLADCAVPASVSFTKNVTVSNDYTIAANVDYALCIGATVTFEGSGMIQRASNISGSAFCVGANEKTRGAITVGTAGTLVFNGGTVCGGNGGNQIKLENGTVEMNGGVLKDGLRGIKADADAGSYTSAIVINGGTITNFSAYAVFASAESATGKATITINGGVIAGPVGKAGKGDETITIPGTSTAKFNADQSSFCESGYETTLSDGWYVVTAVPPPAPSGIDPASATPSAEVTAGTAEAAIEAVEVTTPTEAGSTPEAKAAYKDLFTYEAVETSTGSGVYTVTLTGIKEEVQEAVSKDAVDVLTSDEATVDVPAGLCYKVTTYTALGGAAVETKSGTSDGTAIPVAKPGTTQGFIKVELATKPLN